ncbi:MAG: 3-hydroxyacyl-ACP dehydratase FabZ [Candidatus Marinimicrobia bacterium]|nr:3-hydroxyacyl-ACP dehydratase FabZ [Candidatus Neomarinimicrobiota bacterium]
MIYNKNKKEYSIEEILAILPQRFPFVMIDRIIDFIPGEKCTAIKNVSVNEPYFQGHFPGRPIMPGVLILESMAQAGAFLVLHDLEDPLKKGMLFSAVEKSKFRAPIVPGDQIVLEMKLTKFRLGTAKIRGEAYVNNKLVAEATLLASIVDR